MDYIRTEVPPKQAPATTCDYCGRPFAAQDRLTLHKGLAHYGVISASEKESFKSELADEADELRTFRLKALGMLVILYFGLLLMYAIFA